MTTAHCWIDHPNDANRRSELAHLGGGRIIDTHRRRRGPYTGTDTVLIDLVPTALQRHPALVTEYLQEILTVVPELEQTTGPAPKTLVWTTPQDERTRYVGASWIRAISHGVVSFLDEYAAAQHEAGAPPLTITFDELHQADPSQQELVALLLRRADPTTLQILVGTAPGTALLPELQASLNQHAAPLDPAPEPAPASILGHRSPQESAAAYVAGHCLDPDPRLRSAYDSLSAEHRARLHDAEGDRIEAVASWGDRLGSLPFHREHGSDPGGQGRVALRVALDRSVAVGFSAATLDFGLRGRAVTDPIEHELDYCHFTAKAAVGLVALDRAPEAETLYLELRRRYTAPRVHMTTSYGLAMLHTRFLEPRNHPLAVAHQNNAIALAGADETDAVQRTYQQVFHRNGLALIQMHLGHLPAALELVESGIAQVDREISDDHYRVHRTQLVHNRARLLNALGRWSEAHQEYTRLLEWDPNYLEYWADRAALAAKTGNLDQAVEDYDQAIAVAPPMAELHYNRADVLANLGRLDEAVDDLYRCVELEPDLHEAWRNLAALLTELQADQHS